MESPSPATPKFEGKKWNIPGLKEDEIEYGEITVSILSGVRCEHNLQDFESDPVGSLILTNFKLILKPTTCKRGEDTQDYPEDLKEMEIPRIREYFIVTLGYLLTAEVRPVTEGQKLKYCCIDVTTKDCRKLAFQVPEYKKAMTYRDNIK